MSLFSSQVIWPKKRLMRPDCHFSCHFAQLTSNQTGRGFTSRISMVIFAALLRRGGRAAECTGLENRRWATIRGFKSHLLRHLYRAHATTLRGLFICLRFATPHRAQHISLLQPPINFPTCRLKSHHKIPYQHRTSALQRVSLPISLLPQTTRTQSSNHCACVLAQPTHSLA